jgi:hypothetical protein
MRLDEPVELHLSDTSAMSLRHTKHLSYSHLPTVYKNIPSKIPKVPFNLTIFILAEVLSSYQMVVHVKQQDIA